MFTSMIHGTFGPEMMRTMLPQLGTGLALISLSALLALGSWYLLGAAWLNYIATGKFGDAFNFSKVFKKAFTGKYFLAWIVSSLVWGVLGILIGWIPFIGGAIAGFTAMMISFTLLAEAYR